MMIHRHRIRIHGTVQGVGFRPFVHRLATDLRLSGEVGNDADGVWCEIEGARSSLDEFTRRLTSELPPLAVITDLEVSELTPRHRGGFAILASRGTAGPAGPAMIPSDVAPCRRCLAEIADPTNRRHRYPFTCCTDCGPRFTVADTLPYDRATTAMAPFPLCDACRAEYERPGDRRFHAQATCCAACGPTLSFVPSPAAVNQRVASGQVGLDAAEDLLRSGGVLALKGLGGYQLLCRADDSHAVRALRHRKHRDEKPFAIMVTSIDTGRELATIDELSARAIEAPEAPIVLVRARPGTSAIAAEVAPGTGLLGIMLPASPLHALLASDVGVPLVCTSGNHSGSPIIVDDDHALEALVPIADAWLTHDRRIARRADDSVGQVVNGRFQLLRRARGFVPRAVRLAGSGPAVLGVGAELKSTICLAVGDAGNVSVHLGDLENPATLVAFEAAIADLLAFSKTMPELIVHDLHPEYLSTKFAAGQDLAPILGVQHHHAHLASCLADNNETRPAIGVIFDGLGWGPDGTVWGGEFLIGDASGFDRAAHLDPVPLPGGAAAIREPRRMAIAHLHSAFGASLPALELLDRHDDTAGLLDLCADVATIRTSSIGRLFDAVSSLCGLGDVVTYEGQAAIALEQIAEPSQAPYPWPIGGSADLASVSATPIVRSIVEELMRGVAPSIVAGRFHASLAVMIAEVCGTLRERSGLEMVALSGGVFQNRLLVELIVPLLEADRFTVLCHRQVPPNDGGISLGQVAIGRAHLERVIL